MNDLETAYAHNITIYNGLSVISLNSYRFLQILTLQRISRVIFKESTPGLLSTRYNWE